MAEMAVAAVVDEMAEVVMQGVAVAVVALEVAVIVVIVDVVDVEIVRAPDRTWGRTSSGRTRHRGRSCPRRCRSSPRI